MKNCRRGRVQLEFPAFSVVARRGWLSETQELGVVQRGLDILTLSPAWFYSSITLLVVHRSICSPIRLPSLSVRLFISLSVHPTFAYSFGYFSIFFHSYFYSLLVLSGCLLIHPPMRYSFPTSFVVVVVFCSFAKMLAIEFLLCSFLSDTIQSDNNTNF